MASIDYMGLSTVGIHEACKMINVFDEVECFFKVMELEGKIRTLSDIAIPPRETANA